MGVRQNVKNDTFATDFEKIKMDSSTLFFITIILAGILIISLGANHVLRKKNKDHVKKLKDEINKSQKLETTLQKTKEIVMQNDQYHLSVMHDMKNLVLPLVAYSELLVMDGISLEKMKSIAQKMNQNAGELIDAYTNILEINKEKSNLLLPSPTLWDLYDIVKEIHILLSASLEKKSISFENHIEPEQMVYADHKMIRSVLINLLTNAIKFTHHGGKITIYGKKTEENLYQINVKDNGIGIDEEKREKFFSSSHYISTIGTAGEVGTGFGLALCKDFVHRNGGEIFVENNHDEQGAVFSFTISTEH